MDKMHRVKLNSVRKYINAFAICGFISSIPLILTLCGRIKEEWNILDFGSDSETAYAIGGFVCVFLFCVICAGVCWIRVTTRCGESMLIRYRNQMGNGELIKAQIDSFFETKELTYGVWISNDYIAGIYNTTTIFHELNDLIWIYPVYMNACTLDAGAAIALYLSKSPAYLKLYFKDRKCYTIQLSKASDVDAILSYINEIRPEVVTIYTPEIEESYKRKECPFEE